MMRLLAWAVAGGLLCSGGPLLGADPAQGLDRFPHALAAVSPRGTPNTLEAGNLPNRIDLSGFLPPVQSQGQIGSCAAWATVYYARTLLEEQDRGWGAASKEHQLSPLYSYNQLTQGRNVGTSITAHMALLKDQGIVSLVDFPFVDRLDVQPEAALRERAATFKILDFRSLPRREGGMDLTAVKSYLAQGYPVIGGFELFSDFPNYRSGVYGTISGTVIGGHAMAIVGYDDALGALRIVNSWGSEWGEGGYLWLSYQSVAAMTREDYGCAVMFDLVQTERGLAAPPDLSASKGESNDRITLRWSAQSGTDRYTVLRADNVTRDWKELGTTTKDSYSDGPLPDGVTYLYSVRSERRSGTQWEHSALGPVAEGWTQKRAAAPGIVGGLALMADSSGIQVRWSALVDATGYQVFRYDAKQETFVLIGTSKDNEYRDAEGFGSQTEATYFVLAVNNQGTGLPCASQTLVNPARLPAPIPPKKNDDRPAAPAERRSYTGPTDDSNWFDPQFVDRAFAEFAEKERAAFAAWKQKDQDDFGEFLKRESRPSTP